MKRRFFTALRLTVAAIVAATLFAPFTASAAVSTNVREAQTIMKKFGIPTGDVDGVYGPQTARGLCAARAMANYTPSRNNVDAKLMAKLRDWNKYSSLNKIAAPKLDGQSTYLLVLQRCQAILYVADGKFARIMAASTGMNAQQSDDGEDHRTPTIATRLGYTNRGWSCSTIYPESCRNHTEGMNAKYGKYGNMYNKRQIVGDVLLHGSTDVPPRPASHGCVRVTITDSDWMFKNVGNGPKPYIKIVGSY